MSGPAGSSSGAATPMGPEPNAGIPPDEDKDNDVAGLCTELIRNAKRLEPRIVHSHIAEEAAILKIT
eukprot:12363347-Karenia_brevis.AAC.1